MIMDSYNFDAAKINQLRTANYADYIRYNSEKIITCGWMDFHTDSDHESLSKANPYWTIKILWVNKLDSPVFVYYDTNNELIKHKPVVGETITFNAIRLHGLVPECIASLIAYKISHEVRIKSRVIGDVPTSPKLIWEFID